MNLGEPKAPQHDFSKEGVNSNDKRLYDIEVIVIAATPSVLDTGDHQEFIDFIEKGGVSSTYVWFDDQGNQIGYLALSDLNDTDDLAVRSLAVLPNYQRSGHGQEMMVFAEEVAKQKGKLKVVLVTSPDNVQALDFYSKLGYEITDTVENYYGDGTTRCVLEKPIKALSLKHKKAFK